MLYAGLDQVRNLATVCTTQLYAMRLSEVLQFDCMEYLEWVSQQALNPLVIAEHLHSGDCDYSAYCAAESPCLYDHIDAQILNWPDIDKQIAYRILRDMDLAGYFRGTTRIIAAELGCDVALAERVLQDFQRLDPIGIGARSLVECLSVQARADPTLQGRANAIVLELEHLQDLAENDSSDLAMCSKLSGLISHLNPRPGSQFETRRAEILSHDIEYLDSQVRVVDYMRLKLDCSRCNRYPHSALQQARQSVHLAEQRRCVLHRVMSVVCKVQQDFLNGRSDQLRVLTVREVARTVQMHESMVSRVLRNKVVDAPRGSVRVQKLLSQESSLGVSAAAVRKHVVALSGSGLTDNQVSVSLRKLGICISRRTVCKYRLQAA